MNELNLKAIEAKANELELDVVKVDKELKRLASAKSRLKKQKGRADYDLAMSKVLAEYQLLVEVKEFLAGPKKTVTTMTQADVEQLTYDETMKAIKSIQSKICLTKWLTETAGDNDEYRAAKAIEAMLLEHKENVNPIDSNLVRKTDVQSIIDLIKLTEDISKETIIERLEQLLK